MRLLDVPFDINGQLVEHMLPLEQVVHTPVPIFLRPPRGTAKEVNLYFKPFGAAKYSVITMKPHRGGFSAMIPCQEVSTSGVLRYYIKVFDLDGNDLETLGSYRAPLKVEIKGELEGGAPYLPGEQPPRQCTPALQGADP